MKNYLKLMLTLAMSCVAVFANAQRITSNYKLGTSIAEVKSGEDVFEIMDEYISDNSDKVLVYQPKKIAKSKKKKEGGFMIENRLFFRSSINSIAKK